MLYVQVVRVEIRCEELVQHCELNLKKSAIAKRLQRVFSVHDNDQPKNTEDNKPTNGSEQDTAAGTSAASIAT